MRTIKFFSRNETSTFQQYAKPQEGRGCPEVCGGISRISEGTPSRAERLSLALKQDWGNFHLTLRSWSQSVRDGFSRREARPATSSDSPPTQQHLREDNAVFQTQQKRGAGFLLNSRLVFGACGAVCLFFLSSCAHCPMCGHCGAGASGGKSQVNKERTAQARRSASETGSAQHFETPMHRSPR